MFCGFFMVCISKGEDGTKFTGSYVFSLRSGSSFFVQCNPPALVLTAKKCCITFHCSSLVKIIFLIG